MIVIPFFFMILFYIPTQIQIFFKKSNLKTISPGTLRLNDFTTVVFLFIFMSHYSEAIYILEFYVFFLFVQINPTVSLILLYSTILSLPKFNMNLNLFLSILMLLSITACFQFISSVFIYGLMPYIKVIINKLLNKNIINDNSYFYIFENIENLTDEFILNNGKFIIVTEKIEIIENHLKKIRDRVLPKLYIYELNSTVFNVIKEKKLNYQITDNLNKTVFILFENKFISLIETENTKKIKVNDYISDFYKKESLFIFFKFSFFVIEKSSFNLTRNGDISLNEKKKKFILLKIVKLFFIFLMTLIPVLILNYIPYVIFSVIHSKNSYARLNYEYIFSSVFIIYMNIVFWGNEYLLFINISAFIFFWLGIYILFALFKVDEMFKNISLQDESYIKRSYNLIKNRYELDIQELERKGYSINVFCPSFKDMKNLNYFINDYIDLYSCKCTNENFNYLLNNKSKKRFWHIIDKNGKVFLYGLPSGKIFIEQFKKENIKYYDDLMTECYKEINFVNLFINRNFYENEILKKRLKKLIDI